VSGVLAARTYGLLKSLRPVGLAYGKFPNPDPWAGVNDAAYRAQYQQLMMFSTPFLGPLLSGVTPWGVVVDGDASNDANICLPALSGRVTVTPNAQDIVIAGANLTPADREILVTNTKTGQRFSYPRNVAEFRRDVPGEITHTYEVFVQTSGGLQPVGFEVKRGQPGFTTVRVDMDQVALATTAILIRNTSLAPVGETTVPSRNSTCACASPAAPSRPTTRSRPSRPARCRVPWRSRSNRRMAPGRSCSRSSR
jgi:hypothetical protein